MDDKLIQQSESYIDSLIGPGMGSRHTKFINRLENNALRETLHQYHLMESRTEHLSIEENYLLGMTVLYAGRSYVVAGMFAKTLIHRGTKKEKLLEAVARLTMWVGGLAAAEAAAHLQKSIREYEKQGLGSMNAWFPEAETSGQGTR